MTDQLTEQLKKIIQQASLDGALTQKAVDQFHTLVKQRDELDDKVKSLENTLEERGKQIDKLDADNTELRALQGVMAQRENEVSEREKEMTKLELTSEFNEQRVKDHKEMFTTVFRNSVLRKEVMTPVEATRMDQGMRGDSGYAQRDTVEEEET